MRNSLKDNAIAVGIGLFILAILLGYGFKVYYTITNLPWWMWIA